MTAGPSAHGVGERPQFAGSPRTRAEIESLGADENYLGYLSFATARHYRGSSSLVQRHRFASWLRLRTRFACRFCSAASPANGSCRAICAHGRDTVDDYHNCRRPRRYDRRDTGSSCGPAGSRPRPPLIGPRLGRGLLDLAQQPLRVDGGSLGSPPAPGCNMDHPQMGSPGQRLSVLRRVLELIQTGRN